MLFSWDFETLHYYQWNIKQLQTRTWNESRGTVGQWDCPQKNDTMWTFLHGSMRKDGTTRTSDHPSEHNKTRISIRGKSNRFPLSGCMFHFQVRKRHIHANFDQFSRFYLNSVPVKIPLRQTVQMSVKHGPKLCCINFAKARLPLWINQK